MFLNFRMMRVLLSVQKLLALSSRCLIFLHEQCALDNVMLPMIYSGAPDRVSRSKELLADVDLSDRMDHKPNELSGGQQQRVAVARALVNKPQIIFADEPTGNLATEQSEEILGKLKQLNRSGITIIMVTHEPDIAGAMQREFSILKMEL